VSAGRLIAPSSTATSGILGGRRGDQTAPGGTLRGPAHLRRVHRRSHVRPQSSDPHRRRHRQRRHGRRRREELPNGLADRGTRCADRCGHAHPNAFGHGIDSAGRISAPRVSIAVPAFRYASERLVRIGTADSEPPQASRPSKLRHVFGTAKPQEMSQPVFESPARRQFPQVRPKIQVVEAAGCQHWPTPRKEVLTERDLARSRASFPQVRPNLDGGRRGTRTPDFLLVREALRSDGVWASRNGSLRHVLGTRKTSGPARAPLNRNLFRRNTASPSSRGTAVKGRCCLPLFSQVNRRLVALPPGTSACIRHA
jgi:hypothetical protein